MADIKIAFFDIDGTLLQYGRKELEGCTALLEELR